MLQDEEFYTGETALFISWVRHHGRSEDLAEALGLTAHFYPDQIADYGLLRKYLAATRWTYRLLRKERYNRVFLMLPPAPLLLIALVCKKRDASIVADLHTGFFSDTRWSWFTKLGLRLLRGHTAIVTNTEMARRAEESGVEVWILDDILQDRTDDQALDSRGDHFLCPLTYANDEPVDAILDAARQVPEEKFILTGSAPESVRSVSPPNVIFSGYVDNDQYEHLLRTSIAVLALTDRDFTMQRAGYEALMTGRPQITSDFPVLKAFLEDSACFVEPDDPIQIAAAVRMISRDCDRIRQTVRATLRARISEQTIQIANLKERFRETSGYPQATH